MISLAPIKYRNVLAEQGGPIERLSYKLRTMPDAGEWYEVLAYLRPDLTPNSPIPSPVLYGKASGGGSAPRLHLAKFKAISEALERWAFASLAAEFGAPSSRVGSELGFDLEPTTTGMAAFPGIFPRSARASALHEAIERWSVCAFWEGRIGAEPVTVRPVSVPINAYRLRGPFDEAVTVLLHQVVPESGRHCYAFAADRDLNSALDRASVELRRNQEVLGSWDKRIAEEPGILECIESTAEKRVLHFSTEEGNRQFAAVMERALREVRFVMPRQRMVVDARIKGPWEKYAWVWRCLFEPVSDRERADEFYFMF